jgi:tetratricopeptide (TPR) repeat protein
MWRNRRERRRAIPAPLRLEVAEYADADRWRWVLKEDGGAFLADHAVALDRADPRYPALRDLPGHLNAYATPHNRAADEARLIAEAGDWIGTTVLGHAIAARLRDRATPSVIVRVQVPSQADPLLALPLEIARLDGRTLAAAGVSFVFETAGRQPATLAPVGERLRILALFSLPPEGSPLNLRRERQMLRGLLGKLGLAADLHVLQYGVTRDRLRDVLNQAEGWDIIHFSGHGQPGALWLEHPDGSGDEVSATDLAELLGRARGRVKLVMLSACLSAAASIDQTLAWLGFDADALARRDAAPGAPAVVAAPTVARAITEALDCAVLAMRYAVEDEFAMTLAEALYDQLLRQRQPLPRATRLALERAAPGAGVLSAAAPALFGVGAADLALVAPKGGFNPDTSLAYLPRPPAHFVGRVAAMTTASSALAHDSARSGVLFHGMAGAGKTSCAVELVYHHAAAERFQRFVWFPAPEQGKDIDLALGDFALVVERDLPGVKMVHVVDRTEALRQWLPQLVELLENNAVLIVLDNLESLLTEAGQWRDERWGMLVAALLTEGGRSRTVLTSRIRPADLPASAEVIPVHALPRDEALLLVRELKNLRRLLDGKAPGVTAQDGRRMVREVLRLVQGHPKLIDLAEAQAADPQKLAAQLAKLDAADGKGAAELDMFFQEGESRLGPASFLASLRAWTSGIAGALAEPARLFFHFLCALEEADREGWIIEANWKNVWTRLGRPAPAPDVAAVLAPLVAAALVDRRTIGGRQDAFRVAIHPGVAEAGLSGADSELRAAVDRALAATWAAVMKQALDDHGRDPAAGAMTVRAGLAAFPYLARLGEWKLASAMLDRTYVLDHSPATIAATLPLAQRLVAATAGTPGGPSDKAVLATMMWAAGRHGEAEKLMRSAIADAVACGDFSLASGVSGDLASLLLDSGRLEAALETVTQTADFTKRAGHGPWAQLADEVRRLQILNALGQSGEVLARVTVLRAQMATMPNPPEANDWSVNMWNVRETTLSVGLSSAVALREWQQALDLNAEIGQLEAARGAGSLERARTRFNDHAPLLELKRYAQARKLLQECRTVFEHENAVTELGRVFGALAGLENRLDHQDAARRFAETALRFAYAGGTPEDSAGNHHNLAICLKRTNSGWRDVFGHRLGAALIRAVTRSGQLSGTMSALAAALRDAHDQAAASLPADFAALCATVEQVDGVRFRELMERFVPGEDALNALLQSVITKAMAMNNAGDSQGS